MVFWRKSCSILLQKHFKSGPDELDLKKKQIQRSLCKFLIFLRNCCKNANVQSRTKASSSRLFECQLQFHVRKVPQNDPKIVEKRNKFKAVVWQISELLIKLTKNSIYSIIFNKGLQKIQERKLQLQFGLQLQLLLLFGKKITITIW